jgi:hypothetical protein
VEYGACFHNLGGRARKETGRKEVVVRDSLAQVRFSFRSLAVVLREREGGKVDKGEVEEGGEEEQGRHLDGEGAAAWVKSSSLALLPFPSYVIQPTRLPLASVRFRPRIRVGIHVLFRPLESPDQ